MHQAAKTPASYGNSKPNEKPMKRTATRNDQRRSKLLRPTTDMVYDCCCSPAQGILLPYGTKWFQFRVYKKPYLEDTQVQSNQHQHQIQFFFKGK